MDRARAGEIGNMLWIIVGGVVVLVIGLVVVFLVYGPVSKTIANVGTLTVTSSLVGTQGLTVQMTASGGTITVVAVNIYDTSGNKLLTLPGTLPSGCSLTLYNASGTFTSWGGRQVISPGSGVTIDLTGSCGLGSAYQIQAVSPNGKVYSGYVTG